MNVMKIAKKLQKIKKTDLLKVLVEKGKEIGNKRDVRKG